MGSSPAVRERTNELERLRYQRQKQRALAHLGGKCVRCGTTDDLEFDHINPETKSFTITGHLSESWARIQPELDKCQLLCHPCHRDKSVENGEVGGGQNKRPSPVHGTVTQYTTYGCRCEPCREAKSLAAGAKTRRATPQAPEHGSKTMYSRHRCRCAVCVEGQRIRSAEWRARRTA